MKFLQIVAQKWHAFLDKFEPAREIISDSLYNAGSVMRQIWLFFYRLRKIFLAAPVAFTTILTGLFLIVSRKKAITQAIGFLTFENGITAFGAGMALEYGLVVELGILLDVFVLVFVMGIAVFRISREFQHIDSDRLNTLGDWSGDDENEAEMKGEN